MCHSLHHIVYSCVSPCVTWYTHMCHSLCHIVYSYVTHCVHVVSVHIDGHLLVGIQNRLKHNLHVQRMGQKAAEDVELEAIGRQSSYRVEVSWCMCYV